MTFARTCATRFVLAVALLACLGASGCGPQTITIHHPGAINAFDDQVYTVLIDAKAGIESAKINLSKFPLAAPFINQAIDAYNAAAAAWQLYHARAANAPSDAVLGAKLAETVKAVTVMLNTFGLKMPINTATAGQRPWPDLIPAIPIGAGFSGYRSVR